MARIKTKLFHPLRALILMVFVFSTLIVNYDIARGVGAYNEAAYSQMGILIYNPTDGTCSAASFNPSSLENKNYQSLPVLNSAELDTILSNLPFYEKAAKANDIPWQVIAAVHYRENRLKREGPENGKGPYQIENAKPIGVYSDEQFQASTDAVAAYIKSKANGDLEDQDNIKKLLFNFSSIGKDMYIQQAKDLGFSDTEANRGEGSPYVMNRFDAERDSLSEPTRSNNTWGEVITEGGSLQYPATAEYGAFVIYSVLAGVKSGGCGPSEGGMTLEQAKEFMARYKQIDQGDPNGDLPFLNNTYGCNGLRTNNCVAFTLFFVQKYTTLKFASADGGKIAGALSAANPDVETGTVPKPYSIFGTRKGQTICDDGLPCGHTGIVLGVDTQRGVIIVGEAAYCDDSFTGAREYSLDAWSNGEYTYLYVADHLNKERSGDLH